MKSNIEIQEILFNSMCNNFTGKNMAIIMKVCKSKFINHIIKVLLFQNIHFNEIQ